MVLEKPDVQSSLNHKAFLYVDASLFKSITYAFDSLIRYFFKAIPIHFFQSNIQMWTKSFVRYLFD